ncbi:hypothetical protein [Streptomyces albipurpureus]|uniref:Uncharacterized protein n=1 Tax=Streptomyces albipurpureus TaxID=2897419 RepID=A0ABT0UFZ9_9ACTN|nr:hypothetical protein [Streptomyces sp. CWNU-1]MCM2387330.1 hypothetical protein [Streptomyces sp. CWNU-1]
MKQAPKIIDGQMVFFEDPAIDKLLGMVLALAGETYVLRDRVRVLEQLLTDGGNLPAGAVDGYVIPTEAEPDWRTDRDAFFDRLLGPLAADLMGPEATLKADAVVKATAASKAAAS